ncbi:anaerobic ribonucleoside-triphosphate reductase activating protein [Acidovorax soli]|uniref:Anaerobic ribonucleoside-triphosphate reductase activating protein n=1 Tax=Acidovorax soli TaxID=592050 RepID=A0A7X0PBI6_9BURK|nr:4Fe-4S cluster-binding domain-containing protein [Acidovorax soli]MBB6558867.1 anaerobic ribonucleoside-triphosphate reductase activating protein [Acidovorax soli]
MKIALSRLHFPVTTLGPGRRIGIWFQGCSIRCPGCVSADTWAEGRGTTTVDSVVDAVEPWLLEADGITISGGEPFDQAQALQALLQALPRSSSQDILVFSGHPFETLTNEPSVSTGCIDALISDPFLDGTPQTLPLRGSDNQRLHLLTDLGKQRFARYQTPLEADLRSLDVMFDDDGSVWLAGIPRQGDMHRLGALLDHQGHKIHTTAAPSREPRHDSLLP